MTSNPPGTCCFTGVLHEGTPIGCIQYFDGIETYVSTPPSTVGSVSNIRVLLFLADACGIYFQNNQVLADQFAANGYHVYMPDLLDDDSNGFGSNRDLYEWLEHHLPNKVDCKLVRIHDALQNRHEHQNDANEPLPLYIVSYCFGAKYAVRILSDLVDFSKPQSFQVRPAFLAHPSFVDRSELEAIKQGVSIAAAETDNIFTTEKRRESEEILKSTGLPYEICLFSGVDHGFANKGAMDDRRKQWAKEAAFMQALRWLSSWDE